MPVSCWSSASPLPTLTTARPSSHWSTPSRRSDPVAGRGGIGPDKLHADKGYDYPELRDWLRSRRIVPRIARKGIESSEKLGKHRWVIERSIAWLFGYRRLTIRYERHAHLFCAFVTLAAALTCYKKLERAK